MEVSKVLTAAEVAEIRARAERATPGPWEQLSGKYMCIDNGQTPQFFEPFTQDDELFCEKARTDIPALCDSYAELGRENKRLENLLLTFSDVCKERKEEIADLTAQLAEYAEIIKARWKEYGYKDEFCPADPLVAFDELLQLVTGENDGARQQTMEAEAKLAERDKALAAAREALDNAPHTIACHTFPHPDLSTAELRAPWVKGGCNCWKSRILTALPSAPAPEVLKKGGLCPDCHCSQTLPADLQQCRCACHQIDRAAPPPTPQEESADLIRQAFDVLIDGAPGEKL